MAYNLLFITADEMRGDCLAANGLNADIRTPFLDRFASEGINFSRHFTTFPKCVPARVSLTTGRYPHTDGFRDIFQHLKSDQPDLLSALLERGYEAALFGKNHCWENLFEATHTPPELKPGQCGHRIAHHSWTSGFREIYEEVKREHAPDDIAKKTYAGRVAAPIDKHWPDEAYTRQAEKFLLERKSTPKTSPFYLHVNIESPHPPYAAPPDWFNRHDPKEIAAYPHELPDRAPLALRAQAENRLKGKRDSATLREIQATYYGMVELVDSQVGRILQALEDSGEASNTVVVFLSDHGDFAGQYGLREKWDTAFADCLLHVPYLLRAPGLPKGKTITELSDHSDIAPTLCELLGLAPWPGIHGKSLLPVVNGGSGRSAVFSTGGHELSARANMPNDVRDGDKQETYSVEPDSMARAMCVRTKTHKLVWRETGDHELYSLADDRFEMANRFGSPDLAEVQTQLMSQLLDWQLRTQPDRPALSKVGA